MEIKDVMADLIGIFSFDFNQIQWFKSYSFSLWMVLFEFFLFLFQLIR